MPDTPPLLLALGDSLVAGYGLAKSDAFPVRLEALLRARWPGARVVAAGVSGNTTGDVLDRLPRVLADMERAPDMAIVQVGPNDVLRQVPPARTADRLDAIVAELTGSGSVVLLTTVDPPAVLRDRASAYLAIHAEVAARRGAALCPIFPPGVLGGAGMVLADRVHPNAAAIRAVAAAMLATVERLLCDRLS